MMESTSIGVNLRFFSAVAKVHGVLMLSAPGVLSCALISAQDNIRMIDEIVFILICFKN
jgi:hypothetical protein